MRRDLGAFQAAGFPLEETVETSGRKTWRIDPGKTQPALCQQATSGLVDGSVSHDLKRVLRWVASEAESVMFVRSERYRTGERKPIPAPNDGVVFRDFALNSCIGLFLEMGAGVKETIRRQPISFVVFAASQFEDVSEIPSTGRFRGCQAIVHEDAVKEDLARAIKEKATERLVIESTPVLRITEPRLPVGILVAQPAPNVLIASTDQEVLRGVLRRAATRDNRDIAKEGRQWDCLDMTSPAWGFRVFKRETSATSATSMIRYDPMAVAMTFFLRDAAAPEVVVRYLSRSNDSAGVIGRFWEEVVNRRVSVKANPSGFLEIDFPLGLNQSGGSSRGGVSMDGGQAVFTLLNLLGFSIYL